MQADCSCTQKWQLRSYSHDMLGKLNDNNGFIVRRHTLVAVEVLVESGRVRLHLLLHIWVVL